IRDIDHANRLRAGATDDLLAHHTYAPSTLGTWLRCFDAVSVTQLDLLAGELFVRAWQAGLGPWVHGTVIVDMDSTIAPVFSSAKEGAAYGYTKTLGYHPLVATIADTGEIVAIANRDGNANTATGSRRMLSTIVARLRNHLDIGYSVGVRRTSRMWDLINTIDDDRWVPIDYRSGVAQVAQTWDNKWGRIIVRRVRNIRDGALFDTWEHHAFVTSNSAPVVEADAHHRDHAVVELNIRDLKAGALAHVPSGARHANAAWVICAGIAYNIARWATNFDTAGFPIRRRTTIATIRQFFIAIAVRVCRPQGKPRISGPLDWPAAELIQACNRSIALMPHWSG
ncbi:transposase, partial [Candidatus Neomicrothrix sp.]|uniref:transposase n=1 Tax=Candidatus Neomicrothrix sp. TaxID=2719034 RepID=UPI001B61B46C